MVDCWTCGAERARDPFCPSCGKVQPVVDNTSYFDLLELPPKMKLDRSELERQFRALSRKVHPDNFGKSSPLERKIALEQTTYLNDAYRTLRGLRTRAEYLLKLQGVEVGKEEDRVDDPAFLMEMLELREALEEAGSGDEIEPVRASVEARKRANLDALQRYLDEGTGDRDAAKKVTEELRFLERFLDEVDAKFDDF